MPYPTRNVVMPLGNSQTTGSQSTAALKSAGYRSPLYDAALAAGKAITYVGSQQNGTLAFPQNEGYSGVHVDGVRTGSLAARVAAPPEIIIFDGPTVDFVTDGSSAAVVAGLYTTALNELWDRGSHQIPGGGNTLRTVICCNTLRYAVDLVTINPRIIDFNTNPIYFPGIIAAQVALGRDCVAIDCYNGVSLGADNLHPGDAGYQQWSALIMAALSTRLRAAT